MPDEGGLVEQMAEAIATLSDAANDSATLSIRLMAPFFEAFQHIFEEVQANAEETESAASARVSAATSGGSGGGMMMMSGGGGDSGGGWGRGGGGGGGMDCDDEDFTGAITAAAAARARAPPPLFPSTFLHIALSVHEHLSSSEALKVDLAPIKELTRVHNLADVAGLARLFTRFVDVMATHARAFLLREHRVDLAQLINEVANFRRAGAFDGTRRAIYGSESDTNLSAPFSADVSGAPLLGIAMFLTEVFDGSAMETPGLHFAAGITFSSSSGAHFAESTPDSTAAADCASCSATTTAPGFEMGADVAPSEYTTAAPLAEADMSAKDLELLARCFAHSWHLDVGRSDPFATRIVYDHLGGSNIASKVIAYLTQRLKVTVKKDDPTAWRVSTMCLLFHLYTRNSQMIDYSPCVTTLLARSPPPPLHAPQFACRFNFAPSRRSQSMGCSLWNLISPSAQLPRASPGASSPDTGSNCPRRTGIANGGTKCSARVSRLSCAISS